MLGGTCGLHRVLGPTPPDYLTVLVRCECDTVVLGTPPLVVKGLMVVDCLTLSSYTVTPYARQAPVIML